MNGQELTKKVIDRIELCYKGYAVNVVQASKNGTADVIACIDGIFFAFEIKGTNDTEKALQSNKLSKVVEAGGCGGYVKCIADLDFIIVNKYKPKVIKRSILAL